MLNTSSSPAEKKATTTIDAFATISDSGHACCPRMGWESPYIVIRLDDGSQIKWHSDNVAIKLAEFGFKDIYALRGKNVGVSMLVRNGRVFRMKRFYELQA